MADQVVDKIKERMTHLRLGDSLDKVRGEIVREGDVREGV